MVNFNPHRDPNAFDSGASHFSLPLPLLLLLAPTLDEWASEIKRQEAFSDALKSVLGGIEHRVNPKARFHS